VHRWQFGLLFIAVCLLPLSRVFGQYQPPSDKFNIDAATASTWNDGTSDVILLQGPVTIRTDQMILTADQAVIWLTEQMGPVFPEVNAQIALLGHAQVRQPIEAITRSGEQLLVNVTVRGDIELTAGEKPATDLTSSPTFQNALALRTAVAHPAEGPALTPTPAEKPALAPYPSPSRFRFTQAEPATMPSLKRGEVRFHANEFETVPTPDDTLAVELTGKVILLQTRPNHDFMEIQADRAVLFTDEKAGESYQSTPSVGGLGGHITGAYCEGDVRINFTPNQQEKAEEQLTAERLFYDFVTDRAVLTDVVLHSEDPTTGLPLTIRAEKLRQLSLTEYSGQNVQLTTSSFAVPMMSVHTGQVYMTQDQVPVAGSQQTSSQVAFESYNDTFDAFDVPFFYFPVLSGTMDNSSFPLRAFQMGSNHKFGWGVQTEWGLYETLGLTRPKGLDASFLADYWDGRGPATGLNFNYYGYNIDSDTKGASDYIGSFKSFVIDDRGYDIFGGNRSNVTPGDVDRGMGLFQHQQFLPDDIQVQLRLGWASDPTLLEEYYPGDFYSNQTYDAEAYIKRQEDTEAITLLGETDTTPFVTTSDRLADNFDVEQLPSASYQRIGDSLFNDNFTFYSNNSIDRLRFDVSNFSFNQLGFIGSGVRVNPSLPRVGVPNEGYTGTINTPTDRGDTGQEIDYPIQLGQVKFMPFVLGRATSYSDTPSGDSLGRLYGAAGLRMSTDFWNVNDAAQSDLFDLNRIRHIIEPEVNLYTSGTNLDRDHLYIYDENVDGINDISAMEIALHQRWETYRGPPGRQQSIAFLTLNIYADIFTNPPKDQGIIPDKFRGIYFPSDPEASVARDAINTDATWLLTNSTAILADSSYNIDHGDLATAAIGISAKRGDRLSYYFGLRYIEQLNSDIATAAATYQITSKYAVQFSQSYDFGQSQDVSSSFTLSRQFESLGASITTYYDSTSGDSGVQFNVFAAGLPPAPPPTATSFYNSD
jgi:lipopolysaccharide export system protein LptA